MAYRQNWPKRLNVQDTSSLNFAGQTITGTDEASRGVKMGPYNSFGFWTDISATSGTTETLDITFEWSEDSTNGVDGTWASIVEYIDGKRTAAAMDQITTVTGAFSTYFSSPASSKGWIRAYFTTTGTTPVYTIDSMYWALKDAA